MREDLIMFAQDLAEVAGQFGHSFPKTAALVGCSWSRAGSIKVHRKRRAAMMRTGHNTLGIMIQFVLNKFTKTQAKFPKIINQMYN